MDGTRGYRQAPQAAPDEVLVEVKDSGDGLAATVSWGDRLSDGIARHGETVGPMGVGEALRKADEVTAHYGFARVVVSLPGADAWNPGWGRLSHSAASPADDVDEADDGDEGRSPFVDLPEDEDSPAAAR